MATSTYTLLVAQLPAAAHDLLLRERIDAAAWRARAGEFPAATVQLGWLVLMLRDFGSRLMPDDMSYGFVHAIYQQFYVTRLLGAEQCYQLADMVASAAAFLIGRDLDSAALVKSLADYATVQLLPADHARFFHGAAAPPGTVMRSHPHVARLPVAWDTLSPAAQPSALPVLASQALPRPLLTRQRQARGQPHRLMLAETERMVQLPHFLILGTHPARTTVLAPALYQHDRALLADPADATVTLHEAPSDAPQLYRVRADRPALLRASLHRVYGGSATAVAQPDGSYASHVLLRQTLYLEDVNVDAYLDGIGLRSLDPPPKADAAGWNRLVNLLVGHDVRPVLEASAARFLSLLRHGK